MSSFCGIENGADGSPKAIRTAKHPENTTVGIGIAASESTFIVYMDHEAGSIFRRARPLQDFLAPEHAQVIVDAAFTEDLRLGRIPEGIMSLCEVELLEDVNGIALISGVLAEGFLDPRRERTWAAVKIDCSRGCKRQERSSKRDSQLSSKQCRKGGAN